MNPDFWEKDEDMLYFMGEKDGRAGDFNGEHSWSAAYRDGYFHARMETLHPSDDHSVYLDNY